MTCREIQRVSINNGSVARLRTFVVVIATVVCSLSFAVSRSEAQDGNPKRVTDKVPVEVNPQPFKHGNELYKVYKNSAGQIFKVEKYTAGNPQKETRYIEEVYPNGKPAKETIVTGDKDELGLDTHVAKQQEVYFDAKGNKTKTETYSEFSKGVATKKEVTINGVTTTYESVNGKWKIVYPPSPSGLPTTPLGGSGDPNVNPNAATYPPDPSGRPTNPLGVVHNVKSDAAKTAIQGYMDEIDKRRQEMKDTYDYFHGPGTLEKAFTENGIVSLGHANAWGKQIGINKVVPFYNSHWDEFKKMMEAVAQRPCVNSKDLALIGDGFEKWRAADRELAAEYKKLINTYVLEGKNLQERDQYLAVYGAKYDNLSAQRPYPSGALKMIKDERDIVVNKSEAEYKAIEANESVIDARTSEIVKTSPFKAFGNLKSCEPTSKLK